MPAWSSDLTTDQIDALVGFITSPAGSQIFTQQCGACHDAPDLVAGDPAKLRDALDLGSDFPAHAGLDVPRWTDSLTPEERTALLNFLAAPDGQRLFATNCSACHGRSVSYSGNRQELEAIIRQGGLHLEMPPWRERLTDDQIQTLAAYVADPKSAPEGAAPLPSILRLLSRRTCADRAVRPAGPRDHRLRRAAPDHAGVGRHPDAPAA